MQFIINIEESKIVIPKIIYLLDPLDSVSGDRNQKIFKFCEGYLKRILRKNSKGRIIVNWHQYKKIIENADYRKRRGISEYINLVLQALNILTMNPKNSFMFSDKSMNPWCGLPNEDFEPWRTYELYFKKEEDIINYAKVFYGDFLTSEWFIYQTKKVIKREEIF